ncbi:hypothetical protein RJT34_17213 [Clitoria ternatea]|uniref:Uncharacterized protein n=1 Tax=Clitoria ternatea TaxID=43366 RepID=A0AAN9JBM4_CLITE
MRGIGSRYQISIIYVKSVLHDGFRSNDLSTHRPIAKHAAGDTTGASKTRWFRSGSMLGTLDDGSSGGVGVYVEGLGVWVKLKVGWGNRLVVR